jgi:hypothetical protein
MLPANIVLNTVCMLFNVEIDYDSMYKHEIRQHEQNSTNSDKNDYHIEECYLLGYNTM